MKFILYSSGLETNFSGLKDPAAFLDDIKTNKILIEKARYKQEEFDKYLKQIRIGNKSEKQKKNAG